MRVQALYRFFWCSTVFVAFVGWVGFFQGCEGNGTGQTCTDGSLVGCSCAGQGQGVQVCSAGAWTACNCAQGQCQQGTVVSCSCGAQQGSQSCNAGSWTGCGCAAGGCTDGQKLTCQCGSGGAGTQTCAGGQWSSCAGCSGTVSPPGGDCTTPGETGACSCTGGQTGSHTCGADKKWSACNCGTPPPPVCTDGQKNPCTCTDGRQGERVCTSGQWGACTCQSQNICADGDLRDCICSNGGQGKQKCELVAGKLDWGVCANCVDPKEVCTKPGEQKRCFCPNGAASWQTCGQDGKWASCSCGGPACTEGEVRKEDCDCPNGYRGDNKCVKDSVGNLSYKCQCDCTPGETRECPCEGNQKGTRTCKDDKTYTACSCPTCKKDADCASQTTAKICDVTTEKCVECLKDDQCSGKVCSASFAICVECNADTDCAGKAGTACYPLDNTCKTFGTGSIEGVLRRCQDQPGAGQCAGGKSLGDDKGRIYFLFYTGNRFPPTYQEKPFFVYKTDVTDFKDATKEIPYKIDGIPEGNWLVYVILDDNNNWSLGQHLPDPGDLVGFIKGVTVTANMTNKRDFPLTDRY